jgi:hypothetical protein
MRDADGLLAARFAATYDRYDDSDWSDVMQRRQPRRMNRARVLLVAVAVVAVTVPAAIAFGGAIRDLFFGAPAPPVIKHAFAEHNQLGRLMRKWQRAHGLKVGLPGLPQVETAKAHGVLAVKTRDGLLYLWAAPTADGRQCWFVNFASEQINRKRAAGEGSCDERTPPPTKMQWSYGWSAAHPALQVLSGRLYVTAAVVLVDTGAANPRRLPVVDRYFLGAFPRDTKLPAITAVDTRGRVVAGSKR